MEYIIPAAIVFAGNAFSGSPGSRAWNLVSALFSWSAAVAMSLWLASLIFGFEFWARHIFFPIWAFCLLQILSRDYFGIVKPIADRWLKRRNLGE